MTSNCDFIWSTLQKAGEIARKGFSQKKIASTLKDKADISNIVTETDLEIGNYIIQKIQAEYPTDSIIDEEAGFLEKDNSRMWIIDPIDGTSNFASKTPWFAIMLAKLENWKPVATGIILPYFKDFYYAEKDKGAYKNSRKIKTSENNELRTELISYGIDYHTDKEMLQREMVLIKQIVQSSRNLRASGCSGIDLSYLAEGRFGGCIVQASKIWDNAPGMLIVSEAGGIFTDIEGKATDFYSTSISISRNFTYVAASNGKIHQKLLKLIQQSLT